MLRAIVTAADSNYLPAACCALVSCVTDGETDEQVKLFLLACDVSTMNVEKARGFLESQGAHAEIIAVDAERFRSLRIDSYVSASTYARLLLPEFFDDRWDRLLYLDADTRTMVRLQPLLDIDLRGKPIGAVHDYLQYLIYGLDGSRSRLRLRSDSPYFNAGVVCFDWRATIASGLLQRALAFAIERPDLCKSHDQDALNRAFEGAWAPLDPRWNFMAVAVPDDVISLYYPASFQPYIAHFAGPTKPWMANFPGRFGPNAAWYQNLLRDSPWPHFVAATNAQSGEIRATPSLRKIREWIVAPSRRLWAGITHFSHRKPATLPRSQTAGARASHTNKVSWNDGANPKLTQLLDEMIAEAAISNTPRLGVPAMLNAPPAS